VNILLILIPITLILVTLGVLVFNWAVKSGQYDDLEGPAHRILYDDDRDMIPDDAKQPHQRDDSPSGASTDKAQPGNDKRNRGA
jgi:cbb3-type cytochrome oxidase maturation protein